MGPKHWQKHHTVFILPSTLELRAMKLPVPTPHFVAYTGHYHWTSGDNQLISASAPVLSPSFSIGPITTSFDLSPPAALTFLPVLHLRAYHRILHINPRHHLHPKKKKKKNGRKSRRLTMWVATVKESEAQSRSVWQHHQADKPQAGRVKEGIESIKGRARDT